MRTARVLPVSSAMNVLHSLIELQRLEFGRAGSPGRAQAIERLRAEIPAGVLLNFDRSRQRGRKTVAFVNGRSCSECHIHLPIGVLADIAAQESAQRCPNCGRFIALPEDRSSALSTVSRGARRETA